VHTLYTTCMYMRHTFHCIILAGFVAISSPVLAADLEEARDLMEAGAFVEARAQFEVLARSGNADAEELIGVMYALGLGVERDDERAFEWYLRASMKGHPGAQSGIGWYYELGRGMPAPDLVRAYLWYALSAIGGDIDAPDSLEQLTPRMSAEQRARAEVLVDDYRVWMYPFR
jgi:TPR repeat protein